MAVLAVWQLSTAAGFVSPLLLPGPVEVAIALGQLAASGELWLHLAPSLQRFVAGLAIATACAMAAGPIAGRAGIDLGSVSSRFRAAGPVVAIMLLPLFVVWFGGGSAPIIAATACGVFLPVVATTCAGRRRHETAT